MKDNNKSKNWSIQIDSPTAISLKNYCEERGLKMNWVIHNLIHLCITGSWIDTKFSKNIK